MAGHPREWFQVEEQRTLSAAWGIASADGSISAAYLDAALWHGTTPNGVFGGKVMQYQMRDLARRVAAGDSTYRHDAARLPRSMLPDLRYLWLRRRDSARQAISYFRAWRTNVWWHIEGATPTEPPPFDAPAIDRLERELVRCDELWKAHFAGLGVTPLVMFYEELAADPAGQVARVLQWLGVGDDVRPPVGPPRLQRQGDATTEEWVDRYAGWKASMQTQSPAVPPREIDAEWRRWVAENVLLGKLFASRVLDGADQKRVRPLGAVDPPRSIGRRSTTPTPAPRPNWPRRVRFGRRDRRHRLAERAAAQA